VLVDKSPEVVAAVKNRDQFHGVDAGGENLYHKRIDSWEPQHGTYGPFVKSAQKKKQKST
jgi:hypothetical protein